MTIKDIAAKTGYAVGTVSRALNDHPNVSSKARAAILQAAEECGFELNVNAKQLKQSRSNSILVIVKGTNNELFSELLESIQALIADTRHDLVIDYIDEDLNEVQRAIQLCREKKPLGLLFLGGNSRNFAADFDKIDIPGVAITTDVSMLSFRNLSSVSADDFEIGRSAIHTLADFGHRKIAVIGGDRATSEPSRLRFEGCKMAFAERGIVFDDARDYRCGRYSAPEGYRAARSLLESGRDFTAIFAIADVMAIGAIRALWESGKRVPEDVSVMGVDGLSLGEFLVPQLATIRQNVREMASQGVRLLLDAIEEGKTASHETIPFEVLKRESIRRL